MGHASDIKDFLEEKAVRYNQLSFIETDPVQVPRLFSEPENIEIAGFMAATIAWGQRPTIIKNALDLMSRMDNQPADFIRNATEKDLNIFDTFKHRTFNGDDCKYFIRSLKNITRHHGGIRQVFEKGFANGGSVKSALAYFHETFFLVDGLSRTRKHVSNVNSGSSAKRLNMFLRWMVRKDNSGVDFGLWDGIPPSALMLPLDVHTGNVARKLGLLQRNQNDWKAVEEITTVLRSFDSSDPVKYDYALFGLGAFEKF